LVFLIGVIFVFAIKQANGLISNPTQCLPDKIASNITVPVPQKGSNTVSLGALRKLFARKKCGI
jgi:hypothetical protein